MIKILIGAENKKGFGNKSVIDTFKARYLKYGIACHIIKKIKLTERS